MSFPSFKSFKKSNDSQGSKLSSSHRCKNLSDSHDSGNKHSSLKPLSSPVSVPSSSEIDDYLVNIAQSVQSGRTLQSEKYVVSKKSDQFESCCNDTRYIDNSCNNTRKRTHNVSATVANDSHLELQNAQDLYTVDVTGDINNKRYHKPDRYSLIKYKRSFANVLDLTTCSKIKKSKTEFDNCEITLTTAHDNETNSHLVDTLPLKVSKYAVPFLSATTLCKEQQKYDHDYLPFPEEVESPTSSIDNILNSQKTSKSLISLRTDPYLIKRRKIQDLIDKEPDNPQLWIDLYENEICLLESGNDKDRSKPALSNAQCETLSTIFDKGLEHNPGNRKLTLTSMSLKKNYIPQTKYIALWRETVQQFPSELDFWFGLMDACFDTYSSTSFFDFIDKMVRQHAIFDLLKMKIGQGVAPKRIGAGVLFRLATYYQNAGYQQIAIGLLQAILEVSCFCPFQDLNKTNRGSAINLSHKILVSFKQFWELECPRFGERGAKGWKSTINPTVDSDPNDSFGFPMKSIDPVANKDVYRVVLFEDIEPFLIQLEDSEAVTDLLFGLLELCGIISIDWPLSRGTTDQSIEIKSKNELVYRIVIQVLGCNYVEPRFYQWAIGYLFGCDLYLKASKAILKKEPYRSNLQIWSIFIYFEYKRQNSDVINICKAASRVSSTSDNAVDRLRLFNFWALGKLLYGDNSSETDLLEYLETIFDSVHESPIATFMVSFLEAVRTPQVASKLIIVKRALQLLWSNTFTSDDQYIPLISDLLMKYYSPIFSETTVDSTMIHFHLMHALEIIDGYGRPCQKILEQVADFQNKFGFSVEDYTLQARIFCTAESQLPWIHYALRCGRYKNIDSIKRLYEHSLEIAEHDSILWLEFFDFCVKKSLKTEIIASIFLKCLATGGFSDVLIRRGLKLEGLLTGEQCELVKSFSYERQLKVGMDKIAIELYDEKNEHRCT